jgi:hypothetical protein
MQHPLWREDGSVVYTCHSRVLVLQVSRPYFSVSDSRLHQPGGPGPSIYIPLEQGGPVMLPDTGFPFRLLLRLTVLRWRYWNPPPRWVRFRQTQSQSVSQSVLVSPTIRLLLRVYSLRSNGPLVSWCNTVFTAPLPSNGWCQLLRYSIIYLYLWPRRRIDVRADKRRHISRSRKPACVVIRNHRPNVNTASPYRLTRGIVKTGSMARPGISSSHLHLLHLSATAPSAPLARFFHLDFVRDRCAARATIETKQQRIAFSIRCLICSSKCFMTWKI